VAVVARESRSYADSISTTNSVCPSGIVHLLSPSVLQHFLEEPLVISVYLLLCFFRLSLFLSATTQHTRPSQRAQQTRPLRLRCILCFPTSLAFLAIALVPLDRPGSGCGVDDRRPCRSRLFSLERRRDECRRFLFKVA
jgi:hypothetical protein